MKPSFTLSARLQSVLSQLEKIINELDQEGGNAQ